MRQVIRDKIVMAIDQLQQQQRWSQFSIPEFDIHYPTHPQHGDYATNVAMKLAKVLRQAPLDIAQTIIEQVDREGIERIEIAPPGFINLFVNSKFLAGGVRLILEKGKAYGTNTVGQKNSQPQKILVEFLSANPTGPIHAGNGRGGFTGDCIARVLQACGFAVITEYYINDYGHQLDNLAESVLRRYWQSQGINVDYPDELYKGEYIVELAKRLPFPADSTLGSLNAQQLRQQVRDWAVAEMIQQIRQLVEQKLHIHYDVWKSEQSLYQPDVVQRLMTYLEAQQLIYTSAGAVFFATTKFGDDKDRVIKKANGETTYFFSDLLYLFDKFEERKIDRWVWLLGADHHGYEGRIQAALKAMHHPGKLDVIFVQLMRLLFNGKELRMSKRQGTFVTLEELVDEVGLDVTRWFFLMYDANTHMDFDLNLAREHSDKNPVYYVQYAHARICSIIKKLPALQPAPIHFTNPTEETLTKLLLQLPEIVQDIAVTYQVHHLPQYALDIARAFHKFYTVSRVIAADGSVNRSRLQLVQATKIVLANTLGLMGISAPEKM